MFRKMRRPRQEVEQHICEEILKEEKRGVLSVNGDDGYPYTIPVNFLYEEESNTIYFHGAKAGHKVDAMRQNDKVCFTTWNTGYKKEGDWAWTVTSVVVFGRAELVEDENVTSEKVRKIAMKYYPTQEEIDEEMAQSIKRTQLTAIHIEHMSGKKVHEK